MASINLAEMKVENWEPFKAFYLYEKHYFDRISGMMGMAGIENEYRRFSAVYDYCLKCENFGKLVESFGESCDEFEKESKRCRVSFMMAFNKFFGPAYFKEEI